ncbi:MAG TPA: right-handed parallel beta-helix repeat-containing protein [Acidimicrobiales bacterium]|nr:right-handed parallel beta-helix repeat-containing protein [Acidimicrobiales bacterium]
MRRLVLVLVGIALLLAVPAVPSGASGGRLLLVPQQYKSIGAAVAVAKPDDFILVGPGTYHEAVTVKTPHITIRGVDRNAVVLDGEKKRTDGVYVDGANGVEVDNMTARNYQRNGFWWEGVTGYAGRFLTAQDSVSYGVYAFDSTVGEFSDDEASGHGDSGFYIGQCFDCKALITRVHAFNNSLGYSGTNAGGVVITDSEWDNNMAGIVPNTLSSEEDYPQGGKTGNTISGNNVHDNNNRTAPATFAIGPVNPPIGIGIEIAGGWNNVVEGNRVRGEDHYGIALHWLTTPEVGNQVRRNDVAHSGKDADLAWDGAGADNCWEGNAGASSDPPALETTNGCAAGGSPVGGDPATGVLVALNGAGITEPRSPADQPHGGPADPMPDPCADAPAGCREALSSSRAATPVVVNAPLATVKGSTASGRAASPTTPSTPASTAQIVAGLQHTPTQEELATSLAAALANLRQRPIDVRIPAAGRDLVGGAALTMALLSLLLLGAAAAGWLTRRPPPTSGTGDENRR